MGYTVKKIIAMTPYSPVDETCVVESHQLDVNKYELIEPVDFKDSGSGAQFYKLRNKSSGDLFILKTGARVCGDVEAFRWLATMTDLKHTFLLPLDSEMGLRPGVERERAGYHVTPLIDGPDAFDYITEAHSTHERFRRAQTLFDRGMSSIITHFAEHEMSCANPVQWFEEKTCGEALTPLIPYRDQSLFQLPEFRIDGTTIPNGLKFIEGLQEGKLPNHEILRAILLPRKIARTISDPTSLNELIFNGSPLFIDPGTPRDQQLGYVMCKHEGMFAVAFPSFIKGHVAITTSGHTFEITPDEHYNRMKDIHDIRHVMDRIERIGGSILTHRPFFMVHLMFYGARQFFRDLAYSCAQNNRSRSEFDILMGSIAMDAVARILINTAEHLDREYPHGRFLEALCHPDEYLRYAKICKQAYNQFLGSEESALYRRLFTDGSTTGFKIEPVT